MEKYKDSNSYEAASTALRGAMALADVINETANENCAGWADFVVDDLHGAQRVLLQFAHARLEDVRHEGWIANALLGKYGDEAKAKAQASVDAEEKSHS